MLPNLRNRSSNNTERMYKTWQKQKHTFRSQTSVNTDLNTKYKVPSQSPIHDFVKHRKTSGRTLKGKHKIKKKKNPFMKSLNDYVEVRRRIRFRNVNINDVDALRNSCGNPLQHRDDYSESDPDDSSFDSVKGPIVPKAIQIGRLEDKEISDTSRI
jgi:hypothetical protein